MSAVGELPSDTEVSAVLSTAPVLGRAALGAVEEPVCGDPTEADPDDVPVDVEAGEPACDGVAVDGTLAVAPVAAGPLATDQPTPRRPCRLMGCLRSAWPSAR